jgi:nicotinamidase-related amidase
MNERTHRYRNLISAFNAAVIIVDYQEGAASSSGAAKDVELVAVTELLKAASVFTVPAIVTTIETEELDGQLCGLLVEATCDSEVIKRFSGNPWDGDAFRNKIHTIDRSRLVIAGQCSEVLVTFAVLSALEEGFDTYIVTDATVGSTQQHHETAIERMVQASAAPVTTRQIIFAWQRDLRNGPGSPGSPADQKNSAEKVLDSTEPGRPPSLTAGYP